eukprot:4851848-Prorocentrum_lima.AAC.1
MQAAALEATVAADGERAMNAERKLQQVLSLLGRVWRATAPHVDTNSYALHDLELLGEASWM